MEGERMLTVEQVAERLQLGPETIRRWLRDKRIEGTLMGSRKAGYRITESEVQRVMREGPLDAERRRRPPADAGGGE